jgi:hypothetical protein
MRHDQSPLDDFGKGLLLELVDQSDSIYNDGQEGWTNYTVATTPEGPVLEVTFKCDRGLTYTGRWALSFVDGSLSITEK